MRVMSTPTVVVALKDLASAKSRFAAPAPLRGRLALCMLADTVRGWAATDARVIVVSDVDGLGWRLRAFGVTADVVPDGTGDLNAAFARGATQAGEGLVVASVADLPLLTATVAQRLLADAEALGPVGGFVADATGTGTTVVTAARPSQLRTRFGSGSAAAHAAAGLQALVAEPEARRDVDTEADLPVALDPASATATLVHDGTLGQWDALVVAGHDDETITGVLRDGTRVQVPTRVVSAEVARVHRGQRLHVALGSGREAWSAWAW